MIKDNELKLTNEIVADLIAKKMYNPINSEEDFAVSLFISALVLPNGCTFFDDKEMKKYLIDFMKKYDDKQLQLGVVSNSKPNINYKDIDLNLRELLMQTGERLYFDGKDITDEFLNSDSDLFTIM